MRSRSLVTALALVAAALATPALRAEKPRIEEGKPFPEIVLPSLDGTQTSIADFRGQKVILHVFASW